tara:strand:+ start:369 stop:2087 length:1719 start_codon:yes stop_codon:yes gene_type:complete
MDKIKCLFFSFALVFVFPSIFGMTQDYDFEEQESLKRGSEKAEELRAESKYDSALTVYQIVNDRALSEGNTEYLMRSAIGIGSIFIELKQTSIARNYYREALSVIDEDYKNENLKSKALFGIGTSYHIDNMLDSALYYYNMTQQKFLEQGDLGSASALLVNMTSIYYSRKEFEKAIRSNYESSKLKRRINDFRGLGRNDKMLGRIYREQEFYDSALYYYQKAYKLADSLGYLEDARSTLKDFATLYIKQGKFEEAYNYTVKSDSVANKIFVEGTNDQILDLREKYNTAALELENERQKNLALQQKRYKAIILIVAATLVLTALILLYVMNQRRRNIKALAEKNEEINRQQIDELLQKQEIASLQGVLEGQETERRRVAIDLHDRLGGILSMVKLHFSVVTESLSKDDQAHAKFMKASDLLDQATGEVRSISHNLLSGVLMKFGLVPALEDLKDKISQTGKLKVTLYSNELNNVLSAEQELQLYRIVQELISNILKHSQAKEANIQLTKGDESVNLIVEDDGIGFDLKAVNKKTGIGLSNLKARVAKLNGNFHIDSGRGAGTTISIDIPIHHD